MTELAVMVGVFVASFVAGFLLISKIPQRLHTPLMSMTNAISAVTILGALLLFTVDTGGWEKALGGLAIVMAAFNLVGGFAVTRRMLALFRRRD